MNEPLDLVIIGAGPAGLSAAFAARQEGLRYLVLEKGTIADTIRLYRWAALSFPRQTSWR